MMMMKTTKQHDNKATRDFQLLPFVNIVIVVVIFSLFLSISLNSLNKTPSNQYHCGSILVSLVIVKSLRCSRVKPNLMIALYLAN